MVWLVKTGFDFGHAIANITRAWGADINVVEVDAAAVNVLVQKLAEKGGGGDGEAYEEACTCAREQASEDRDESGGVHSGGGSSACGGCEVSFQNKAFWLSYIPVIHQ